MDVKKYKVLESFEMTGGEMSVVGAIVELQDQQAVALGSMVELYVEPKVGDVCEVDGKEGTLQDSPDGMICVANEPKTPPTPPTSTPSASTPPPAGEGATAPTPAKPWAGNHKVPS